MNRFFAYAIGTATEARLQFTGGDRRNSLPQLVIEALDQRDCPLFQRTQWKRLARCGRTPRQLLQCRRSSNAAGAGDVIIVPDVAELGPIWRSGDRGLADALRRGLTIVIAQTHDGPPIELANPLDAEMLRRLEKEAAAAKVEYHRRRIREALAATQARGTRVGRPSFGWRVDGGKLIPNESDLETIRDVCRWHDEHGWTLKAIAEELAARGTRLACGRPWNREFVTKAWRYGVSQGWARQRRRPWDVAKKRVGVSEMIGEKSAHLCRTTT